MPSKLGNRKGLEEHHRKHSAKSRRDLVTKNKKAKHRDWGVKTWGVRTASHYHGAHKGREMFEPLELRRSYFTFSGALPSN